MNIASYSNIFSWKGPGEKCCAGGRRKSMAINRCCTVLTLIEVVLHTRVNAFFVSPHYTSFFFNFQVTQNPLLLTPNKQIEVKLLYGLFVIYLQADKKNSLSFFLYLNHGEITL